MKVTIGLPHQTERIHTRFINSLISLMTYSIGQGVEIDRIATFRDNITFARNKIASKAYRGGADYLFFLDDDMVFEPETLMNLLAHRKDIVGGLTFIRTEPHDPSFYAKNSDGQTYNPIYMWKPKELVKCDAIGMAATLISRDTLHQMKESSQFHKNIWGFFDNFNFTGEDLRFCDKAGKLGLEVYCDTDVLVGHLSDKIVAYGDYEAMAEERRRGLSKHIAERRYGQTQTV